METFLTENQLFLFLIVLWTLPWKGYAMWIAAKKEHKWWFIAILVLNTLAILDILYIFFFSKRNKSVDAEEHNEVVVEMEVGKEE